MRETIQVYYLDHEDGGRKLLRSVTVYQSIRHYIPEDVKLHFYLWP